MDAITGRSPEAGRGDSTPKKENPPVKGGSLRRNGVAVSLAASNHTPTSSARARSEGGCHFRRPFPPYRGPKYRLEPGANRKAIKALIVLKAITGRISGESAYRQINKLGLRGE